MSVLIDVAEAIKDNLNAGSFTTTFTAQRSYGDTQVALEDQDTLHVEVIPQGYPDEIITQGNHEYEVDVRIWVRKRFGQESRDGEQKLLLSQIDTLVDLVEDIQQFFIKRSLTGYTDASWRESTTETPYSAEHLRIYSQFTGQIKVIYKVPVAT